jgi:hypothetical protein
MACAPSRASSRTSPTRPATTYNLAHLRPDQLPTGLAPAFEQLEARTTWVPALGNEGTIAATVATMTEDQAGARIEDIVRLYVAVAGSC